MFASEVRRLFDFYRRGAAVSPPRRDLDRSRLRDRALVAGHLALTFWVGALLAARASTSWRLAVIAVALAWLGHRAVDPVNGLVHFALDNYFDRTTPVVGTVVDGFLNHHEAPAAITRIQFARNVAPLVTVSLPALATLAVARPAATPGGVAALAFFGVFFAEGGFSLEPHKYAHMRPEGLPATIRWMQRHGWLVSAAAHAKHHARRPAHETDYAAMSGRSNRYLTSAVLRRLERLVYDVTRRIAGKGVEPRSWRAPEVRRSAFPRRER